MSCLYCSRAGLLNASKIILESGPRLGLRSRRSIQPASQSFSSLCRAAPRPITSQVATLPRISSLGVTANNTTPSISSLFSWTHSSPSLTRNFSASAALGAPRRTFNPSRRVQKRRHGFLARIKSRGGRNILARRRAKGRKSLSW